MTIDEKAGTPSDAGRAPIPAEPAAASLRIGAEAGPNAGSGPAPSRLASLAPNRAFSARIAQVCDVDRPATPKLAALARRMAERAAFAGAAAQDDGAAQGGSVDPASIDRLAEELAASPSLYEAVAEGFANAPQADAGASDRSEPLMLEVVVETTASTPSHADGEAAGGDPADLFDAPSDKASDPFAPAPLAAIDAPAASRRARLRIDDFAPHEGVTPANASVRSRTAKLWTEAEPRLRAIAARCSAVVAAIAATPALLTAQTLPFAIAGVAGVSALGMVALAALVGEGTDPFEPRRSADASGYLESGEVAELGLEERHQRASAAVRLSAVMEGLPGTLREIKLQSGAAPEARTLSAEAWFALPSGECARRSVTLDVDAADTGAVAVRRFGPEAVEPCPGHDRFLVEDPERLLASAETVDGPFAAPEDLGALVTGDIPAPSFVPAERLESLLLVKPIRCVDPATADAVDGPRLGDGCAERTDYDLSFGRFTTVSPLEGGLRLEVSGGLQIDGDEVCHLTEQVSALVIGDGISDDEALAYERAVEKRYADIPGGAVCHRFREVGVEDTYAADSFVLGRPAPERSDPRAFELRTRG